MIKYQLICSEGHEFEAWFRCSNTFEIQSASHHIECPHCGSLEISKSVMAPQIARRREARGADETSLRSMDDSALEAEITKVLHRFRAEVEARAEYVGKNFAEEARDMHFDEKQKRNIWGEATREEVRELIEDDVDFAVLPRRPEESD